MLEEGEPVLAVQREGPRRGRPRSRCPDRGNSTPSFGVYLRRLMVCRKVHYLKEITQPADCILLYAVVTEVFLRTWLYSMMYSN